MTSCVARIIIEERRDTKFQFGVVGTASADEAKATAEFEEMEKQVSEASSPSLMEPASAVAAPATTGEVDIGESGAMVSNTVQHVIAEEKDKSDVCCVDGEATVAGDTAPLQHSVGSLSAPTLETSKEIPTAATPAMSVSTQHVAPPQPAEVNDRASFSEPQVKEEGHEHDVDEEDDDNQERDDDGDDDDEHDGHAASSTPLSDEGGWDMDAELECPVDDADADDRPGIKMYVSPHYDSPSFVQSIWHMHLVV